MESVVIYLFQANLFLVLFYVLYRMVMRNETMFNVNRFYLLFSGVLALILPLVKMDAIASSDVFGVTLPAFVFSGTQSVEAATATFSWSHLLLAIYGIGAIFFLARFLMGLNRIRQLLKQSNVQPQQGYKLVLLKEGNPSFSFFNYLFLGAQEDQQEEQAIVQHEEVHIRQAHSVDIVFWELIGIVFWYNPIWIGYKTSLQELHEFIADEVVVSEQYNREEYSQILFNQIFGLSPVRFTNNFFNQSLLKRRIIMMNKSKSNRWAGLKYTLVLPLIGAMVFIASCTKEEAAGVAATGVTGSEKVYDKVDNMPEFNGGKEGLMNYLMNEIKYPKSAKEQNEQGRVMISFVIAETGAVEDVEVVKSVSPALDAEALRVITAMPAWTPGKKNGATVKVKMNLPIAFVLSDDELKGSDQGNNTTPSDDKTNEVISTESVTRIPPSTSTSTRGTN